MGPGGDGEAASIAMEMSGAPGGAARPMRFRRFLVWLLRLLSVVWLAKGLMAWAVIFGLGAPNQPLFETRLLSFQAITVYFAVIDLVAAVGLWLVSTWGGVLWLLATISQLLLGFFFPRLLPMTTLLASGYVMLIVAYFVATWAAENEAS